jgi:hypothetical protein
MNIMFFWNGNVAVTNGDGKQMPKFQRNCILEYLKWMQANGADIFNADIDVQAVGRIRVFRVRDENEEDDLNYAVMGRIT